MVEAWWGKRHQLDHSNPYSQDNLQLHQQEEVTTDLSDIQIEAEHAKAILENPLFKKSLDEIRLSVWDSWKGTGADEVEEREKLFKYLKTIDMLEAKLKSYIARFVYETEKQVRKQEFRNSIV